MKNKNHNKAGYTIIETMISVSIFMVVIAVGMGALLNANLLHEKSRDMRSIMDSLNFAMEDMSRNLRTGYDYQCLEGISITGIPSNVPAPANCGEGWGIYFFSTNASESGGSNWLYYIGANEADTGDAVWKRVEGESGVQITPSEIKINAASGFVVTGAKKGALDNLQPMVTIRLSGEIEYRGGVVTPFSLQTTVSQRNVDVQ